MRKMGEGEFTASLERPDDGAGEVLPRQTHLPMQGFHPAVAKTKHRVVGAKHGGFKNSLNSRRLRKGRQGTADFPQAETRSSFAGNQTSTKGTGRHTGLGREKI